VQHRPGRELVNARTAPTITTSTASTVPAISTSGTAPDAAACPHPNHRNANPASMTAATPWSRRD
jgi:hypothetical protein